jgi:hypothetical protein
MEAGNRGFNFIIHSKKFQFNDLLSFEVFVTCSVGYFKKWVRYNKSSRWSLGIPDE